MTTHKYKLSLKSLNRLNGVDDSLVEVVKKAILITEQDFTVLEGIRTPERQQQLLEEGATKTLASKHLDGLAVDLGAWEQGQITWDLAYYIKIARAMRSAAKELGVTIRWGAAWHTHLGSADPEQLSEDYVSLSKKLDRAPFIDAVHFELM